MKTQTRAVALTPTTILDHAVATGATPEVIEKLMSLQERWEANQARKAFTAALSAAKAKFPPLLKQIPVDQGHGRPKYKYEDLAAVCAVVDEILPEHGLYYNWRTVSDPHNGWVTVTCILSHELGHAEESSLTAPPDTTGGKNQVQSVGSTTSYLQRYTLKAALGLAAEADNDGRGGKKEEEPPDLPINSERANEIRELAERAGLDAEMLAKGLGAVNATKIEEISEAHFHRVVRWLNRKIDEKGQQQHGENRVSDLSGAADGDYQRDE
jgi:hypothetical protein